MEKLPSPREAAIVEIVKTARRARELPEGVTRDEAKLLTRRRLLEAATRLLGSEGYAPLTASKIAREAGIAQSSFYVHFKDKDDLLRTLADEMTARLRRTLRDTRRFALHEMDRDRIRGAYRAAIEGMKANREVFLLFVQEERQVGSPLGEYFRELAAEVHADFVEDLVRMGFAGQDATQRRIVEMAADAIISMAVSIGVGHIEGRYPDLEECVELLAAFTQGPLAGWSP